MNRKLKSITFSADESKALIAMDVWQSHSVTEAANIFWSDRNRMTQSEAEGHVVNMVTGVDGYAKAYAADADEAVEKVQAQINAGTLDDDLQMEDFDSGNTMPYGDVKHIYNVDLQTDGVEVLEDDVDPCDVLEAEIGQLQKSVCWNSDVMATHKAFLETLAEAQAVAQHTGGGSDEPLVMEVSR